MSQNRPVDGSESTQALITTSETANKSKPGISGYALTPDDRARAHKALHAEKRVRVDTVVDLMAAGKWTAAKKLELQRKWDCSLDAIGNYASAASIVLVHLASPDKDRLKAEVVAGVEALRTRCEADPDPKSQAVALKAYELLARIYGLEAPKQVEMTHKVPTREEAIAELREAAKHDPTILDAIGVPIPESE